MEHTSDLVAEGKQIDTFSYAKRAKKWKELEIEGVKIDHFDPIKKVIREVKKSNKREYAHIAQLKYYLFVLRRNGIDVSHGILEYPKLRETEEVWLDEKDYELIPRWEREVLQITSAKKCPPLISKTLCKQCAYFEFCIVDD